MKLSQVGAQLYTIREHTKTPADIAVSMKKIREIGYETVQVSGMGPIPEEELMQILDGEGLKCVVTHEPANKILEEPQEIAERLDKLNCTYVAYPHPAGIDFTQPGAASDLAKKLNSAGQVLADRNKVLLYHNHGVEFLQDNGKTVLEILYDETDAKLLQGEPDTYWIQVGGGSPEDWCRKLRNRMPIIHLKDFRLKDASTHCITEIGNGNINWKPVIAEAEKSGCEWFVVEQDDTWINGDPFESLRVSYEYIKSNLVD